ncbi:GSCFA domain-containing protein [Paragemmobacter straminiformis]|uniref:GSCFA domain-containing protein n=1 Tax=Paragemmobacter straminiformis TaxID=2045119 RepID=A0A842I579_9RHOB|nr:GSCFA domain-containing protein [Gemmobacter straminiformis]MBC2834098.1 GSCFA domain-containing protein [Gemmobacter straminiformis]
MARSPYQKLERRAFWKTGVEARASFAASGLFRPRFAIDAQTRVATAGSCFAQHVGRALRAAGVQVIDAEPVPDFVPDAIARDHGYRLFSARHGNIYTAAHLAQLAREVWDGFQPAEGVWPLGPRFVDSQRPSVEPGGHASEAEVVWHRQRHLGCIRKAWEAADVFVFTFGLTEAFLHRASATVYPMAPGVLGGAYDPDRHMFHNYTVAETVAAFRDFMALARAVNPALRFLVTVSPVPLAATASGDHVEVATIRSKAILRAACDEIVQEDEGVDYFPSYEIVTSQSARGRFFADNLRDVTEEGVATVMATLRAAYGLEGTAAVDSAATERARAREQAQDRAEDAAFDLRCEEALLNRFAGPAEAG